MQPSAENVREPGSSPWRWLPTLYFAEGLPYILVTAVSVVLYTRLGLSNTDIARTLGVARGTVQSRLARLLDTGVITGWGPDLDPRATDHPVTAFVTRIARRALSEEVEDE